MPETAFEITSRLPASRESVWRWITSLEGISTEMAPYFRMTAPRGVRSLADLRVVLGSPLFRSQVYLFGVVPLGRWDFTLIELEDRQGFVELSPSGSMKSWRHERRILATPDSACVLLTDRLRFVPAVAPRLVGRFIRHVFAHRHRVLESHFRAER
jgi:ligand-binding SRPBCC domain-containing protein